MCGCFLSQEHYNSKTTAYCFFHNISREKFEDTKWIIKSCKSNVQMEKDNVKLALLRINTIFIHIVTLDIYLTNN
jgi:hypothetical protein